MQIHRWCEENSRAACPRLMTEGITEFVQQFRVECRSEGGSARNAQGGHLRSDPGKCRTASACGSVGHGDRRKADPFDAMRRPHRRARGEESLLLDGQLRDQPVDVTHVRNSWPSHAELGNSNCRNLVLGSREFDLGMRLAPVEKEDDLGRGPTKSDGRVTFLGSDANR